MALGSSVSATETESLVPWEDRLPKHMEVLFVDDENILRKLFIRTVKKVAPTWRITEASNGERALQLAEVKSFDLIFIDQFMPCNGRPLLGTEVVRKIRAMGIEAIVCGLSANDMKQDFIQAGANGFLHKPFPCKNDVIGAELKTLVGDYIPLKPVAGTNPPSEAASTSLTLAPAITGS